MDLGIANKAAIVLASTAGLGRAVAEALLAEGVRVAVSGRDAERLEHTVSELRTEHGDRVFGAAFDLRDLDRLERHCREVREHFGSVDILVTNAGGPPAGAAANLTEEQLQSGFDLTFRTAFRAVKTTLPWMRERGWGRIVGMTSSSVRQPIPLLALSNSMRAGLTAWLKTLSCEVARDGVLVNTICTGMFGTDRLDDLIRFRAREAGRTEDEERARLVAEIPVGRIGRLEEFGAMVAFMCSERASFLNGVALPYDGGASRSLL